MEEKVEINNIDEKKSAKDCKCAGKEKSSGSCKGGCSCGDNSIKKASQELVDLLKVDLF